MSDKKRKDPPGKKRKYQKPKIAPHGNLRGLAERVTGANVIP